MYGLNYTLVISPSFKCCINDQVSDKDTCSLGLDLRCVARQELFQCCNLFSNHPTRSC